MTKIIKIAIQHSKGSFSERWIDFCKEQGYKYKLVNSYSSDIIQQLENCTHFLWNFHHAKLKDKLFAKQLIFSIEKMGIKVFPNFNTVWHFDDKIGQKYLLESIGAPLVKTQIFYDKESALEWANTTIYPVVFKLRGGAGSSNVRLIKSKSEALNIVRKAFSKGFRSWSSSYRMKENWIKFKRDRSFLHLRETIAGFKNYMLPTYLQKLNNIIEKGYIYIQDYLPDNDYDIRIIVVGNKAVGLKRMIRKNDFRASGSGLLSYNKKEIDLRCVRISFDTIKKLKAQCIAFDYIFDQDNNPKIVEISYGFPLKFSDPCEGYWDSSLRWYPGRFNSQYWIIEELLQV